MESHTSGTYLNTRCAISTFKKLAEPLLDVISEASREMLTNSSIMHFFTIPDLPQNIPLLYQLIRWYRPQKSAFLIGQYYIKMTVNEVAIILGLPNRGIHYNFKRLPLSTVTQTELVQQLNELANIEGDSDEIEKQRVDALAKYVLCRFLFPLKSLRLPLCLEKFGGVDHFRKYNWPKAVHAFLHTQIEALHNLSCSQKEPGSLGYLEGCSIVLVVWFFEYTNIQVPMNKMAQPRLCRWMAKSGLTHKFCEDLPRFLFKKKEVIPSIDYFCSEKRDLFGDDVESDSDFEEVLKLRVEKKNVGNTKKETEELMDKEKVERMKVKCKKEKEKKKKERDLKKLIKREIRQSEERILTEVRGKFDTLVSMIKSMSEHVPQAACPTPSSPLECVVPLVSPDTSKDPIFVSESTPDSKGIKRSRRSARGTRESQEKIQFPGRAQLTSAKRELIDSTLSRYGPRDCVIACGNASITRAGMEDLLGQGWLMDSHLDAYAVILNSRRTQYPKEWRKFLYVSPTYVHYKASDVSYDLLLANITSTNVKAAEIILMPVHCSGHWTLLTCHLREERWYFYDSLPNSMHRSTLPSVITSLQQDTKNALPSAITHWEIIIVGEAPTQEGGDDCGIFVLKYMEAEASKKAISWSDFQGWQKNMPRFRAEIAVEMLQILGPKD